MSMQRATHGLPFLFTQQRPQSPLLNAVVLGERLAENPETLFTRACSAAGSPRKDTEDHGRLVCIDCARGWDHERHESHERYASSTINLKASPTWWILLKIPSVTDGNRFGILWETSRSRTFSKVHDIRTFSQTVGAARPSGARARALHKMAATDLDPPTEFQLMSTRNCGSFRVTSILDSKKLLLRRKS